MRKMILTLAIAGSALALAACASQPKSAQQTAQQKEKMVCFNYMPTGSHVPKRVCMSKEAYAAYKKAEQRQSRATQDMLLKMQSEGTENAGGGGVI